MKKLLASLFLGIVLISCGGQPQEMSINCPDTCDPSVQAPPMPSTQIYYYSQNPAAAQAAGITQAMLDALVLQDMMWRNCWDCYGSSYYSRYGYYSSYSPAQRTTVLQQNTTVINNNKTVIQHVAANPPAAAKSATLPARSVASAAKPATNVAPKPAPAAKPASGAQRVGGVAGGSSLGSKH